MDAPTDDLVVVEEKNPDMPGLCHGTRFAQGLAAHAGRYQEIA
jgi:hypothetical protein